MHISGIANNAISFSGVVTIINNKESNKIYLSPNFPTFQIADFILGDLFELDTDINFEIRAD